MSIAGMLEPEASTNSHIQHDDATTHVKQGTKRFTSLYRASWLHKSAESKSSFPASFPLNKDVKATLTNKHTQIDKVSHRRLVHSFATRCSACATLAGTDRLMVWLKLLTNTSLEQCPNSFTCGSTLMAKVCTGLKPYQTR